MITIFRAFGRISIILTITAIILVVTILAEIFIDQLTSQTRDLQHLLKHSLGNIGAMMIFLSLAGYMIKRRWKSFPGMLKDYLQIHQWFAVIGTVFTAIHSGAHFSAIVPLVTFAFMLICLISGFVGRYVYTKTKQELSHRKKEFIKSGARPEEVEEKLAFATAATQSLSNWRQFHKPVATMLLLILVLHIISALFYGG